MWPTSRAAPTPWPFGRGAARSRRRAPASPTCAAASARAAISATISASTTASAAASAARAASALAARAPRWPSVLGELGLERLARLHHLERLLLDGRAGACAAARRRPAWPGAPAATRSRRSTCACRRPSRLLGDGLGLVLVALLLACGRVASGPGSSAARARSRRPGDLGLGELAQFGQRRVAVPEPVEREVALLEGQERLEAAHRPDANGHAGGPAVDTASVTPRRAQGWGAVAGAAAVVGVVGGLTTTVGGRGRDRRGPSASTLPDAPLGVAPNSSTNTPRRVQTGPGPGTRRPAGPSSCASMNVQIGAGTWPPKPAPGTLASGLPCHTVATSCPGVPPRNPRRRGSVGGPRLAATGQPGTAAPVPVPPVIDAAEQVDLAVRDLGREHPAPGGLLRIDHVPLGVHDLLDEIRVVVHAAARDRGRDRRHLERRRLDGAQREREDRLERVLGDPQLVGHVDDVGEAEASSMRANAQLTDPAVASRIDMHPLAALGVRRSCRARRTRTATCRRPGRSASSASAAPPRA